MLADPATLGALQSRTRHIRNICILAHVDHGKTTLSDYLLSSNGIISPKLAGKVRFLDSRPDEQERGITMKSTSIALLFNDKRAQQEAALVQALSAATLTTPAGTSANADANASSNTAAASNAASDLYLINLIDSPGHVDFSSEVSNAVRVSDGCLILVDVLEGICVQTHAVMRQAWNEGVKPVLVLNKIDRLISELHMSATEAYRHIVKVLEDVNVVASTFITADAMEFAAKRGTQQQANGVTSAAAAASSTSASTDDAAAAAPSDHEVEIDDSKQWDFAPEKGNVVFASAYDCWAFTIPQFSTMLAAKLGGGMKPQALQRVLWGEYYFDAKNKKVTTKPPAKNPGQAPMFVQMIFENLFALYQTVLIDKDDARTERIIAALGLKVLPRELSASKEPKSKLQLILSKWLPIPAAILGAVVDHLPDPIAAQGARMERVWPGFPSSQAVVPLSPSAAAPPAPVLTPLQDAVRLCSKDYEHVLIYVSKMVDMGDMIKKLRETTAAAKVAAANAGPGPVVRTAYQKGRFTAAASTAPADASAAATPAPAAAAPAPAAEPTTESAAPGADATAVVPAAEGDDARFVAFARIWCGTLRIGAGAPPMKLHLFGPKYDPNDPETHALHSAVITLNDPSNPANTSIALYLLMGTDIQQIMSVPAGNVFAIGGLSQYVLNTATLSTDPHAPPFRNMQYQSAPIVRVAIETEKVSEMALLKRGLKLLNQADANVQIKLLDSGEHVIIASGELHLERCVRDLKDRFCPGVKLIVSPPLIAFRETCLEDLVVEAVKQTKVKKKTREELKNQERDDELALDQDRREKQARKAKELSAVEKATAGLKPSASIDDMQDAKARDVAASSEADTTAAAATVKPSKLKHLITDSSANKLVTITVQAIPLPSEVTRALEERQAVVSRLVQQQADLRKRQKHASQTAAEATSPTTAANEAAAAVASTDLDEDTKSSASSTSASDTADLITLIRTSFASPSVKHLFSPEDVDRIWAFGPRSVGPNMLINRVDDLAHLTALLPKSPTAADAASPTAAAAAVNGSTHGSVHGGSVHGGAEDSSSATSRISLFRTLSDSIYTGFQLACLAGPLCEEPLMGVAFALESIELHGVWDTATRGVDPFGPLSGQTMSLMQRACRAAFDARARRLMEAVYRVELQCSQEALGGLHGVLAKRRGAIFSDELREGTTTYMLKAWLPVAESFGFAGDVRKKTGGEASPQLIFDHWEVIQQDPFFVPRSEEELEFHGALDATPNLARDLVDHVRRRKGLAIQQKTVEHAEKQRTIKK